MKCSIIDGGDFYTVCVEYTYHIGPVFLRVNTLVITRPNYTVGMTVEREHGVIPITYAITQHWGGHYKEVLCLTTL